MTDTHTVPSRPAAVAARRGRAAAADGDADGGADAIMCCAAHGSVRAESPVVESTATTTAAGEGGDAEAVENEYRSNKRMRVGQEVDVMVMS